ncbi:MAG: hypothetical protein DWP95_06795 [Proteobacteria bacterium]|nr:MAG: hypothetical protein DWP95_06795 [Pseudomonadota bacterium]
MNRTITFFILIISLGLTNDTLAQPSSKPYTYEAKLMPARPGLSGKDSNFGGNLSIDGNRILVGDIKSADSGVAYIYESDGVEWEKVETILPPDAAPGDGFGQVSLLGDFALIGAPGKDVVYENDGIVYLYGNTGNKWQTIQSFTADNPNEEGSFGCHLKLTENFIFISACDEKALYVYMKSNPESSWIKTQKIKPDNPNVARNFARRFDVSEDKLLISGVNNEFTGTVIAYGLNGNEWLEKHSFQATNSITNDNFGSQLAIDQDWALVKNGNNGYSPSVDFYRYNGSSWQFAQRKFPDFDNSDHHFGNSFSVYGDRALVGHTLEDVLGGKTGAVYHYKLQNDNWFFVEQIKTGDGQKYDYFGSPIAQNDEYVVVGAFGEDTDGKEAGAAYIFEKIGGQIQEIAKITGGKGAAHAFSGNSISLSENHLLVSADSEEIGSIRSGAAYIYFFDGLKWVREQKLTGIYRQDDDRFGSSVFIKGSTALVGDTGDQYSNFYNRGSVYVFEQGNEGWQRKTILSPHVNKPGLEFGAAVVMDDNFIFVSAIGDDVRGSGSGSVHIFEKMNEQWNHVGTLYPPMNQNFQYFGRTLGLSSEWLVVYASRDGNNFGNNGALYFYDRTNLASGFTQKISASDLSVNIFYDSLVVNENQVFIGTRKEYGESAVYQLGLENGLWVVQSKIKSVEAEDNAYGFGTSLAYSDNKLLVGDRRNSTNSTYSGAAFLFEEHEGGWQLLMRIESPDATREDYFGSQVAISGSRMVVSAIGDDTRGTNSGATYVVENDLIRKHGFEIFTTLSQ